MLIIKKLSNHLIKILRERRLHISLLMVLHREQTTMLIIIKSQYKLLERLTASLTLNSFSMFFFVKQFLMNDKLTTVLTVISPF